MSRFAPLFSGSSGNCTYVGCGDSGILIDAGVSAKRILAALADVGVAADSIRALFVTHEHADHIAGVKTLCSRLRIPLYASWGTLSALSDADILNDKFTASVITGNGAEVAGMHVLSFATSHDARESCGYMIETPDGRRIAICTDLGYVSPHVRAALTGCDLCLLESNHDVMMLQNGPYPYALKRRILGQCGHMSNASCADELPGLLQSGTTRFVLGHLSRENNYPELAEATAAAALTEAGAQRDVDYVLTVAPQAGGTMLLL